MPNWTSDQQKAITTRGGKVIVSAAAGSGKTAVLSQRVIEYVLSLSTRYSLMSFCNFLLRGNLLYFFVSSPCDRQISAGS